MHFCFAVRSGVGKTTCARILGKTINCENQQPMARPVMNALPAFPSITAASHEYP